VSAAAAGIRSLAKIYSLVTFSVAEPACIIVYLIDRLYVFNIIQKILKRYQIRFRPHLIPEILPITA